MPKIRDNNVQFLNSMDATLSFFVIFVNRILLKKEVNHVMKLKRFFPWVIAYSALFALLQSYCRFHFFYEEQIQLFLLTADYASNTLFQPGGLSLYLSRALVQFFLFPYVGAAITAGLILGIASLTWLFLRSISTIKYPVLLSFLPALSIIILQLDFNCLMQGTVSFLLMVLMLALLVRIKSPSIRMYATLITLPVLYFLAGPIANLAAITLCIREMQKGEIRWYWALTFVCEALLISFGCLYFGWMGNFRIAFLPDAYIDPLMKSSKIYIPWGLFLVSCILTLLLKKHESFFDKKPVFWIALQIALLLPACFGIIHQYRNIYIETMEELDFDAQHEKWNEVINCASKFKGGPMLTSFLNLALVKNGELGESMFHYDQQGIKGLVPDWEYSTFSSSLLSDISFCMNDIALSQKNAFEGNQASISDGCPRLLKRLVETNLLFGAYPVAEKYIEKLENTLFYKGWATSQRKYLNNDPLLEKDPVMGYKRKALFDANHTPIVNSDLIKELEQLAVNYPVNQTSMDYLTSLFLLNRDLKGFKSLLDTYYGTPVWPKLSISQQEGVFAVSSDNPDYCWAHGVSFDTANRFEKFQHALSSNSGSKNRQAAMSDFSSSYWYYLLFKKE